MSCVCLLLWFWYFLIILTYYFWPFLLLLLTWPFFAFVCFIAANLLLSWSFFAIAIHTFLKLHIIDQLQRYPNWMPMFLLCRGHACADTMGQWGHYHIKSMFTQMNSMNSWISVSIGKWASRSKRMGEETMICQDSRGPHFSIELEIFYGEFQTPPPPPSPPTTPRKSQVQWKCKELWNLGKS